MIGLIDCAGIRLQEATDALNALQQELSTAAMAVNPSLPEATEEVPGEAESTAVDITPETQTDMLYRCQELTSNVIEKINDRQQSYLRRDLLEYFQFFTAGAPSCKLEHPQCKAKSLPAPIWSRKRSRVC